MKLHTKLIRRSFKQPQRQAACFTLCLLFVLSMRWDGSQARTGTTAAIPAISTQARAGQEPNSAIWQPLERVRLTSQRWPLPSAKASAWRLNAEALARVLQGAPLEGKGKLKDSAVVLSLPLPDGTLQRFQIEESPMVEPGLAAKFPNFKTYRGKGLDDRTATVRFDWLPTGLHALILSAKGSAYLDPQSGTSSYIVYFSQDAKSESQKFECLVKGDAGQPASKLAARTMLSNGAGLRSYRLAAAATGQYTQFHGGTVAGALAAMTTTLNRVNGIFERDLAVRLMLVANNNAIIYTNPNTDPYFDASNIEVNLSVNQTTLDSVIGSANYDIGHLFNRYTTLTNAAGVAVLGSSCIAGLKAQGTSGLASPDGDAFDVRVVAHEIGHQFGAAHTFNGTQGTCNGARAASAAYEPGSGSTIMSYAGLCDSQNLQALPDDYFHRKSLDQMLAHLSGVNACVTPVANGNTPPTVSVVTAASQTIPPATSFRLTAAGNDVNGDALTYNWEEYDLGPASPPDDDADGQARPLFRSLFPSEDPSRNFNQGLLGSALPQIARTLNFEVTARDQLTGIATAATQIIVNTSSAPFVVPDLSAQEWEAGETRTINWNVGNTTSAPFNVTHVRLVLYDDLAQRHELVASTLNDGSHTITVPDIPMVNGGLAVEAIGNVFYAGTGQITIYSSTCVTSLTPANVSAFSAFGGDGSFTVNADPSCLWRPTTTTPWLTLTSGAGVGTDTVSFTAAPNTTLAARTGTIRINANTSFTITQAALTSVSGVLNVGTGPGQDFASLTTTGGLFETLNQRLLTGNLTVNITSDLTAETGAVPLNQPLSLNNGEFTITLKPSGAGRTISGNGSEALLKLRGVDRFTLDGSLSGGTDRSLTLRNTNTSSGLRAVIWLASLGVGAGATHNIFKNLNITTSAAQTIIGAPDYYGILACGDTLLGYGDDNDDNLYENNYVTRVSVGIATLGSNTTGTPNFNTGTIIRNNLIGPAGFGLDQIGRAGIYFNLEDGAQVTGNEVRFVVVPTSRTDGGDALGIIGASGASWRAYSGYVINARILGNRVHDIINVRQQSAVGVALASGATGGARPRPNSANNSYNNIIANNFIYNVRGNIADDFAESSAAIAYEAGQYDLIAYNSIYLSGDLDPPGSATTNFTTYAIHVYDQFNDGGDLTIRNNVVKLDLTSNDGQYHGIVNWPDGFNWGTGGLDYNDWYPMPGNPQAVVNGTYEGWETLAGWQAGTGQDAQSLSADPLFVSATDLHIQTTPLSPIANQGKALASVLVDYDGNTRHNNQPDIGADEFDSSTSISGPLVALVVNETDTVNVTGNVTVSGQLTLFRDLNLGGFTLTHTGTCGSGTGDVIGNVRRVSLATGTGYCFGNAENKITFNAGTPPTELTINLTKTLPSSLGNAVTRLYTLTPTGGSGYSATVRLHYLDSELNGLNESVLQLWRHTGTAWESPWTQTRDGSGNWVEASGVTAFSPWAIAGPSAPTAVQMAEFLASSNVQRNGTSVPGVELRWRTGYEVDNLGFNVYREVNGARVRVNPALIAGSALLAGRTILTAGLGYAWLDAQGANGSQYWLEEVDLNGASRWYGPVGAVQRFAAEREAPLPRSLTLGELNAAANQQAQREWAEDAAGERVGDGTASDTVMRLTAGGWALAGERAAKLSVRQAGWYRVTQAELAAVGFDTNVNPALLQLFADGVEVPLKVVTSNLAVFGPGDSIEFYGQGLDTPTTDTRVYWLARGATPGRRINLGGATEATQANATSFISTVERKDKLIYFSGLLNGEAENWFGPVISGSNTTVQTLDATAVDRSVAAATLEVAFQGVTATPHAVVVTCNGQQLGTASYANKDAHTAQLNVPISALSEGTNEVRFTALGGSGDVSLVSAVRLRYPRLFRAANNQLRFSLQAGQTAYLNGFTSSRVRLLALDRAGGVEELKVATQRGVNGFGFFLYAPVNRTFLATTEDRMASVAEVKLNQPSKWSTPKNEGDFVIFTHGEFVNAARRLADTRQAQGFQPVVVDVEDAYDEFNFGARSPDALKGFLRNAHTEWQVKPRFVLLLGDGSTDPRDYLALGAADLVPAKLLGLTYFETAADNWYADLNDDQVPELALGRLPVRTVAQAEAVITKLLSFTATDTTRGALFVSDRVQDGYDYPAASLQLAGALPANAPRRFIKRTDGAPDMLRQQIISQINQSPLLVNWQGHGSTQVWTGDGLLRVQDASALTNAQLALFVMTTCLNGYFIDPQQSSLGEAVLLHSTGGAFGVIASSSLGNPAAQLAFNQQLYLQLLTNKRTLGEALQLAKQTIADTDLRQSYTLLGDPTSRVVR